MTATTTQSHDCFGETCPFTVSRNPTCVNQSNQSNRATFVFCFFRPFIDKLFASFRMLGHPVSFFLSLSSLVHLSLSSRVLGYLEAFSDSDAEPVPVGSDSFWVRFEGSRGQAACHNEQVGHGVSCDGNVFDTCGCSRCCNRSRLPHGFMAQIETDENVKLTTRSHTLSSYRRQN